MKRILIALGLAALSLHSLASPRVGVSVNVSHPGVYGRVDIGNVPAPPVLVYEQPVIISQPAVVVERRPIYLHVPEQHSRNWRHHCGRYSACGQPVYFVREDWHRRHYHQRYDRHDRREWREERHHRHHRHDRHHGHDRRGDRDGRHHGGHGHRD